MSRVRALQVTGVLSALILLTFGSVDQLTANEPAASRPAVVTERFMIAAANPLATKAGYDILKAGGSAIDAALAVQLVLTLVEPQSSGIGGGATMLYWDAATKTLHGFDGRETAPASATPERFLEADGRKMKFVKAVTGGQSVGVPGALRLFEAAHKKFGKKPWADAFKPAIELAERGFKVSPRMANSIAKQKKRDLGRFPAARAYFFTADGQPLSEGTLLKNPAYAETLRIIARDGADAFYTGAIAEDVVKAINETSLRPNNITLEDMKRYRAVERLPVCAAYRAYRVCSSAPPTSGGITVNQILGVLSHFDLRGMGWSPESAHLYAEAAKLAYADRAKYMADSDFVPVPIQGLVDPGYLKSRAKLVDPKRSQGKAEAGDPPAKKTMDWAPSANPGRAGTSHFVIRDAAGNAVSLTTTIETVFGSRVMVRGFLLNNQLTDFDRKPERDGKLVANRVEGGKRPRSSKSPTIVFRNGEPYLLVGSPGGSRIISYVAQTIIGVLDWDMDPQQAIEMGRAVHRNGKTFDLEKGTETAGFASALEAMGHKVKIGSLTSGLHAILIKDGKLIGGADPRREGVVMGE